MKACTNKYVFFYTALVLLCCTGFMMTSAANARDRLYENSLVKAVSQEELLELLAQENFSENYALIDTRTPIEYKINRIPSSINIPHYKILDNISVLDSYQNKQLIFYCQSGVRVEKVTRLLSEHNYDNLAHLQGDIRDWKANNRPLE